MFYWFPPFLIVCFPFIKSLDPAFVFTPFIFQDAMLGKEIGCGTSKENLLSSNVTLSPKP